MHIDSNSTRPHLRHRVCATLALIGLAGTCLPQTVSAQSYPTHPLRFVVGVPPGGTVDLLARLLATPLSAALGQPVLVDNRPGAASRIGAEYVAKSAPDGYTIMITSNTNSIVTAGAMINGVKLAYDLVKDFQAVSNLVAAPYALAVRVDSPIGSTKEFIAMARAKPDSVTFGSSGIGAVDHLAGALFASMAGVKLLHVPHKGMGAFTTALLGGEITSAFASMPALVPFVKSGKIKLLATLGSKRVALFPDLPTVAESGPLPGYDMIAWLGVVTVAGTPRAIVDRLNSELNRIVQNPQFVKEHLAPLSLEPVGSTPESMLSMVQAEIPIYARIIKENGIVLE